MQRILQRTSIYKFPFLWVEEHTKASSRSDKALVALAGKRTSEVYTQALARATPTSTVFMQPGCRRDPAGEPPDQSYVHRELRLATTPTSKLLMQPGCRRDPAGEPPEQSRDLWELRLACAGAPSWFARHFALWVVAPTVNGDPVPPPLCDADLMHASALAFSCEIVLCRCVGLQAWNRLVEGFNAIHPDAPGQGIPPSLQTRAPGSLSEQSCRRQVAAGKPGMHTKVFQANIVAWGGLFKATKSALQGTEITGRSWGQK